MNPDVDMDLQLDMHSTANLDNIGAAISQHASAWTAMHAAEGRVG